MPNDKEKMEDALRVLKLNKVAMEEGINQFSNLFMHRYKSLQEAGFTKKQAFQIILERGLE